MKDFITIHKQLIHNREAVEVEMSGSMQTLASMIYSAMKNDEKFATIVLTASNHFQNQSMFDVEKINQN